MGFLMREGPILRVDAFGSVENAIVDVKQTIISVEQDSDGLVLVPWYEIKMVLA